MADEGDKLARLENVPGKVAHACVAADLVRGKAPGIRRPSKSAAQVGECRVTSARVPVLSDEGFACRGGASAMFIHVRVGVPK
jgi:hypothetical protein